MERKCDKFNYKRKKLPTFNQIEAFELGYKIKECNIQLQRPDENNANSNEIKKQPKYYIKIPIIPLKPQKKMNPEKQQMLKGFSCL